MLKLLGVPAAVLALLALAPSAQAATILSADGSGTGTYNYSASGVDGVGQWITAPSAEPLTSFSLGLDLAAGSTYVLMILNENYAETGGAAWGFDDSVVHTADGTPGISVSGISVMLTPGAQYLLSVHIHSGSGTSQGFADSYSGGFADQKSDNYFHSVGWSSLNGTSGTGDMKFQAVFGTPDPVPEPTFLALIGMGAAAAAARRRRS